MIGGPFPNTLLRGFAGGLAMAVLVMGCGRKRQQEPVQDRDDATPSCGESASGLIFLINPASELIAFDPTRLAENPFSVIAKLSCAPEWSPYSMAVDRTGSAWVLYDNGELFKVNTADGGCAPTGFVAGSSGVQTFAMGFVADQPPGELHAPPGATTAASAVRRWVGSEQLFIVANDPSNALHSIETSKDVFIPRRVGTVNAPAQVHPELTGTGDGKLYGFFPMLASPSFVQEIDKTTGAGLGEKWQLGTEPLGEVNAYAFAHWRGVFFVFVTQVDGTRSETSLRTIDRATGAYRLVLSHLPFRVSGAGVSTCAPFEAGGKP